jgi:hypothetical protein
MTRATIASGLFVAALVVLGLLLVVRDVVFEEAVEEIVGAAPAITPWTPSDSPAEAHPGFLYGRITDVDGATYEGRLRWGGDQEAFWNEHYNGVKTKNPFEKYAPPERRSPFEIFGIEVGRREGQIDFVRQFMARFGDIARIDADFGEARVTLKSGTVFTLDRFSSGDIDDGMRVWDRRGIVDLDTRRIRTIEFLPAAPLGGAPKRLHGTVRTQQGDFTGFIRWGWQDVVDADELEGRSADGEIRLPYTMIRSIARRSPNSALVTLVDGRELVLGGDRGRGDSSPVVYAYEERYGGVQVSWDVFERVDFSPGGSSGPGYGDFQPGRQLTGTVRTRDGRRIAGRLVYDFDESETTETLDGVSRGVDYNVPLGLIASIVLSPDDKREGQRPIVILRDGEEMPFERSGDFGDRNAGLLIFVDGREPEFLPWADVAQIDLDRPSTGR